MQTILSIRAIRDLVNPFMRVTSSVTQGPTPPQCIVQYTNDPLPKVVVWFSVDDCNGGARNRRNWMINDVFQTTIDVTCVELFETAKKHNIFWSF